MTRRPRGSVIGDTCKTIEEAVAYKGFERLRFQVFYGIETIFSFTQ